eukprot:TRINITY_DN3673_c0_g1_i1.p1 TRINITY_DN3673_c0_g1~~TRINITY_DN3673_c0_g1_i1.p1  ORF type:complete len:351 (+),score=43.43 TRINITY_DN3673_c0_g1_i1:104-1156(+)
MPRHGPPKDRSEDRRHRKMIDDLDRRYRRKVEREAKENAKRREARERHLSVSARAWISEILPQFDKVRNTRKVRQIWWQGIPPSVRGLVWPRAIGNQLQITRELFEAFHTHAERHRTGGEPSNPNPVGRTGTVDSLQVDLPRTFPALSFFHHEGPWEESLRRVLETYAFYRPDVGYVQGMSYLVAMLLLYVDEYTSFCCLANILSVPSLHSFFRMDMPEVRRRMRAFEELMAQQLPTLHKHFTELHIDPQTYLLEWVLTLFSKSVPLDLASRIWDCYFMDGEPFIFRAALGILSYCAPLLESAPFEECLCLLTRLPQDMDEDMVFESIASINLTYEKFCDVLAALPASVP